MQTMGKEGLRLDAVPAVAVHLHLPVQRARHHPDHLDAGDRPHGDPAVPRPDRVGRSTTPSGSSTTASVPHRHAVAAAACRSALRPLVGAHRVPLEHPPAAVLAWPSDSSPTCSPGTCCWSPSPCSRRAVLQAETKQFVLEPMGILPFFMLLFLTAFEVLVGFLQAYIFTILTAVYIGRAAAPRALTRPPPPSPTHTSTQENHQHMEALAHLLAADAARPPTTRRRPTPPSAPASPTASPPSAPASASATSSARPSRRWPASPRPPAWSAPRCSSASPSPRRSP